jgi:hypothetical protein
MTGKGRDSAGPRADPLFRREALAHRADPRVEPALLRSDAWVRWPSVLVVLLVAGTLTYVAVARIPASVSGPALLTLEGPTTATPSAPPSLRVWLLLPDSVRTDIGPGRSLEVSIEGMDRGIAYVDAREHGVGLAADERCRLEARASGLWRRATPMLVRAYLPRPAPALVERVARGGAPSAHARLALGHERLLFALFPDLRRAWRHVRD